MPTDEETEQAVVALKTLGMDELDAVEHANAMATVRTKTSYTAEEKNRIAEMIEALNQVLQS